MRDKFLKKKIKRGEIKMINAMDRLIYKIKELNNPTVIGLDPKYEMIPEWIKSKYEENLEGVAKAILEFNKLLIDEIYDIIPAIKPNVAFYEMYGLEGMKAFEETCKYAKSKNIIVIADIKRGDIGSTAKAYSNAFLGKTKIGEKEESIYDVDFVTLNPYMGTDSIKPFIEDCKKYNKGAFVIVKTSNPSSGELQDLKLENGEDIYTKVAKLVEEWGSELIGEHRYSSISAVVGATYPKQLRDLRKIAPHTFFLIPGYGAQGGKAEDIALGFDEHRIGGIVNSSRGLMYAYKSDLWKDKYNEKDFGKATRQEALRMKEELNQVIKSK